MKHFGKTDGVNRPGKVRGRMSQKERGQYAVMKRNQRKAKRRQERVIDTSYDLVDYNQLEDYWNGSNISG